MIARDGRGVFAAAYGEADRVPFEPLLDQIGFRSIDERSFEFASAGASVWVHDVGVEVSDADLLYAGVRDEVQRLFAVVRDLKARGRAVLYVSHRLQEVFEVCDAVTVLRDGRAIVAEVDWTVNEGERWVVLGPNGAGKSTLLAVISTRFPRASKYNPDWVTAWVSGAANPLWLAEWLAERHPAYLDRLAAESDAHKPQ